MSIIKYLAENLRDESGRYCQNVDIDLTHLPEVGGWKGDRGEWKEKEELCYMIFDKHRYFWNNCDLIYNQKGKDDIDYWNNVKYLDYKITTSMFEDEKSYDCLKNFLINSQDEKILHIVNTFHEQKALFDFDEWTIICQLINKFSTKHLTVEVLNKSYWANNYVVDLTNEIKRCKEMLNCYRLDFFLYFKKLNFFHIPLISCGIDLPIPADDAKKRRKYKKYKEGIELYGCVEN